MKALDTADRANILQSQALRFLPPFFVVHNDKQPLDLETSGPGAHGNAANQRPLNEALEICCARHASGIGFSVPANFLVVDFDDVVKDDDNLEAWALAVLAKLPDTLVEYSPSGRGLHAFVSLTPAAHAIVMKAAKTTCIGGGKLELLRCGFYCTITGRRHFNYPDQIAELDTIGLNNFLDRVKQVARSTPTQHVQQEFSETIYKASPEEIQGWRESIRTGVSLHEPTFKYAWWSAYTRRHPDTVEFELHELYNQCENKDERWRNRQRKINTILERCYRKAEEFHKIVTDRRVEQYQLSESGNASIVEQNNEPGYVYTPHTGWLAYNGMCYDNRNEHQVREAMAKIYEKALRDKYAASEDVTRQKEIHKHIMACQSNRTRTATEMIARGRLSGNFSLFDVDPTVLNCQNGVVDLKTGVLLEHDRSFKITALANVPYVSNPIPTPCFDQFMKDFTCNDAELEDYLYRCIGYSLTGETNAHKFFVMYGLGGNGKTTFTNIIKEMIGASAIDILERKSSRYFSMLRPEALISGEKTDQMGNDLAGLAKTRFVLVSELGDRKIKDERLKALTGEDSFQIRYLYHEFFEMIPKFKLWIQTNQRPHVRGTDEGIWRRAVMLPCLADFRANPNVNMNEQLRSERVGIFAKFVRYAMLYYKEGLPPPPSTVVEETAEWREEVDSLARFIREALAESPVDRVSNQAIWNTWLRWCDDNNEKPGTSVMFHARLKERGFKGIKARFEDAKTPARGYAGWHIIYSNQTSPDSDSNGDVEEEF